jgi:hypothetical protein
MRSYTSYTILAFGMTAFVSGVHTLFQPVSFMSTFSLPPGSEGSVRGNALAAIAMGLYYTLSSVQENRSFFIATVPMRLLTATVFAIQGGSWIAPAMWEAMGAAMTGIALLLDRSSR